MIEQYMAKWERGFDLFLKLLKQGPLPAPHLEVLDDIEALIKEMLPVCSETTVETAALGEKLKGYQQDIARIRALHERKKTAQ